MRRHQLLLGLAQAVLELPELNVLRHDRGRHALLRPCLRARCLGLCGLGLPPEARGGPQRAPLVAREGILRDLEVRHRHLELPAQLHDRDEGVLERHIHRHELSGLAVTWLLPRRRPFQRRRCTCRRLAAARLVRERLLRRAVVHIVVNVHMPLEHRVPREAAAARARGDCRCTAAAGGRRGGGGGGGYTVLELATAAHRIVARARRPRSFELLVDRGGGPVVVDADVPRVCPELLAAIGRPHAKRTARDHRLAERLLPLLEESRVDSCAHLVVALLEHVAQQLNPVVDEPAARLVRGDMHEKPCTAACRRAAAVVEGHHHGLRSQLFSLFLRIAVHSKELKEAPPPRGSRT